MSKRGLLNRTLTILWLQLALMFFLIWFVKQWEYAMRHASLLRHAHVILDG